MATDAVITGSEDASSKPSSKIRVTFFESERPLIVSDTPVPEADPGSLKYSRQFSTESGQDNPFRPDGNLSREADEIVQLIKRGKPVSVADEGTNPNGQDSGIVTENPITVSTASPDLATKNGSNGSATELLQAIEVQHGIVASPTDAGTVQHVHIKKDKGCCVIQ